MTIYIHTWKNNQWLNSNKKLVAHKYLLKKLENLLNHLDVKFEHVPGHQEIYGHEKVDELAKKGAGTLKKNLNHSRRKFFIKPKIIFVNGKTIKY